LYFLHIWNIISKQHIWTIKVVPAPDPSCQSASGVCKIIYPYDGLKIFLPRENAEKQNDLVFKAYHRQKDAGLFWFIDDEYKTSTTAAPHECIVKLGIGVHKLTITDQWGNRDQIEFEILGRE
jgi:penicillin-binding protein 1C